MDLSALLKQIKGQAKANRTDADLLALGQTVAERVSAFLVNNNLATRNAAGDFSVNQTLTSMEAMAAEIGGAESLNDLVKAAGIPADLQGAAAEQVAFVLFKHYRKPGSAMLMQDHLYKSTESNGLMDLSTMFSASLASQLAGSTESFGANINTTVPDLKMAITVALMRFHMGVLPRMMPVRPTSSPAVQYKQPRLNIFDLSVTNGPLTPLINLYKDPSMVSNDLPKIVALDVNDTTSCVVRDGVLAFSKQANILTLGIDASKPGYGKINHTDTVADGVRLKSVYVSLTDGTLPAEQFELVLPMDKSRLTRLADSNDSADRLASITHEFYLTETAKTYAGVTTAILAPADSASEGIKVTLQVTVRINLKNGVVSALGSVAFAGHHVAGGTISAGFTTALGTFSIALVGYELDARYSEENMRKTSIAMRQDARSRAYELPIGRHYVADSALTQEVNEETATNLTKIVALGEDHIGLSIIKDTLETVYNRNREVANGLSNETVGDNYVAGHVVKPTVLVDTFDISTINAMRDSDRSGDIKQRALSYLQSLVARLHTESYLQLQMAAGAKVCYRMVTDPTVLGLVFGQPHIHNHLNGGALVEDGSGVEYRLVLPDGTVIEVVTSTYKTLANKFIMVPFIKENPESILNFGSVWDMGTIVGNLTPASGEIAFKRLYANARQLAIPTCPVGAIVDITGVVEASTDSFAS